MKAFQTNKEKIINQSIRSRTILHYCKFVAVLESITVFNRLRHVTMKYCRYIALVLSSIDNLL